ncbi:Bro-N domain-containing protein [Catellatospora sp. NPDC049609]|uniref:BRO-N domain-containing protein n=1 Tax=Catellatospora sp. NPDC049609 TaxID=3155505 RepID=UPI00343ED858
MNEIKTFVFPDSGEQIQTVKRDGGVWLAAPPIARALGYRQAGDMLRHLDDDEKGTHTVRTPGGDQEVTVITESGLFRALAARRVGWVKDPEMRARVEKFQRWVFAEVLPAVFRDGGYVAPWASPDQLDQIVSRAEAQARVLRALGGIADPAWLEAKARHIAARAMGEEPEIDPARWPLTIGEYLADKGIQGPTLRSVSPVFGKLVKTYYRERYAVEPAQVERFIDGALRMVAGYTEAHRDLMDRAWRSLTDRRLLVEVIG